MSSLTNESLSFLSNLPLVSNSCQVDAFNSALTNSVIDGRYKLTGCTYKSLEKKLYPYPDIVIMYFDKEMVKKGTFKTIVQIKGRLGQRIPILTLMEEGTPQNIFSTLMAGAYDYLEIAKSSEEYRKKIEDIARWNWYLRKYRLKEK